MHFEGKYFSFRGIWTRNFFEKHFEKQHKKFFFEKLRVQILSFPQTFYACQDLNPQLLLIKLLRYFLYF